MAWGNLAETPELKILEPGNLEAWEFGVWKFGGLKIWWPGNLVFENLVAWKHLEDFLLKCNLVIFQAPKFP